MTKNPRILFDKQDGFTIIELVIATGVFAVILLVITVGIIGFTRQYYKGVITSNTQTTARALMSEITQAIQFGGTVNANLNNGTTDGFCIDSKVYSYIVGQEVIDNGGSAALHQGHHGFVADNNGIACNDATIPPAVPGVAGLNANQRELLGEHMRLSVLKISTTDGRTYTVHMRLIYGDDDVLTPDPSVSPVDWSKETCLLDHSSLQYCAVSDLTTTVQKRVE